MRLLGYVIGFGLFLCAFLMHSFVELAFDAPTALLVFGASFGFAFAAHGSDVWRAIGTGFLGRPVDGLANHYAIEVLQTLRGNFLSVGIAGALIGGIMMSPNVTWDTFGPAFGVLLLSPFYGLIAAEFLVRSAIRRLEVEALKRPPASRP